MSDLARDAHTFQRVPFSEAAWLWLKIGLLSFGGAPAQIAMLHRSVVEEKKWLDEQRFVHALNYCMLLPGPEAQQLATYIGWLLHGVRGGLVAGILFVLPGAVVMMALSFLYALGQGVPLIDGLFFGIKCAVLAIIAEALLRIARRAIKGRASLAIAVVSFAALFFFGIAFPVIVIAAGLFAAILTPLKPHWFGIAPHNGGAAVVPSGAPTWRQRLVSSAVVVAIGVVIWFAPVLLAALILGSSHVLVDLGLFFSKLAVLTFGGAYALLAWLAQAAVETKGWLTAPEMLDGLGLAETTPGPTILVNQFVGFIAALRAPGTVPPYLAATLGAMMVVWVTFVPSFIWIFAGAPFMDDVRRNRRLAAALSGITAAVVGVIAYLSVWFALQVLFASVTEQWAGFVRWYGVDIASARPWAIFVSALAFALLFVWHKGLFVTLAVCASAGILLKLGGLI
ncbi:MAG: chromate efflux transporter [Beijerinckiaceae bacterium]